MTFPKIINEEAFLYLLRGSREFTLEAAIHDSYFEIEGPVVHSSWQTCRCNMAQELREEHNRLENDHVSIDGQDTKSDPMLHIPANSLTFEEWKEVYNDPQKLMDAYNALFCSETKPIVEMSAEELGARRFFLEKLMTQIKIQYKRVLDLESAKMEALDEIEQARIRELDKTRRSLPAKQNAGTLVKLTDKQKLVRDMAKTRGISEDKAAQLIAELADDVSDLVD